ncbi:MAG: M50 family metallopeptidase [Bacillota bacterium]|nr:M50 family metallopeptidase [Bacillota bacterium]
MNKVAQLFRHIHIHPLLWIVIAIAVATARFMEVCLMLVIVFVHEMGHAAAASFFSWRIKRITLLPFGGVAEMDEHGNRPLKEEAIVVLAGPIQHIWMLGAAFLLYRGTLIPEDMFLLFFQYNMMILLFNLFPVWPLDGGKLLFLLFSLKKPFPIAHRWALRVSFFFLTGFSLFVLFTSPYNLNVWIVSGFLYFSLYHEWKQRHFVFIRFLLERYYGKKESFRLLKPLQACKDDFLFDVLARFQRGCKHPIQITGQGMDKRMVDENELLHAYFSEKRVTDKIGDLFFTYS